MRAPSVGVTLGMSAAEEDVHTRRAPLDPTKAGIGCAALGPGPFLSAVRSFKALSAQD